VIDPRRKTVSVAKRDTDPALCGIGDHVPLPMFDSVLDVELIFF